MKCFDDTERKGARGRNNCRSGTEVGLSCQAACQRQCHTVLHPASEGSSKWRGVFLRGFPLSDGGGAQAQLAVQAHPASVIRSVTHVSRICLHQTQYATFKAIKKKLWQLMVHIKQWQKNRLKCLDLPIFYICFQSIFYF